MGGFCYHYDGTFAGFLCCVRDIYQYREPPSLFLTPEDDRPSLYDERYVETDEALARRVYRRLGQRLGAKGLKMVLQVGKAIRHLQRECDLLTGFVRFSDYGGVLAGEIAPKNQVLPVLRVHFCDRLAESPFLLFDKTHSQLLIHQPGPENRGRGKWVIVEARDFSMPPPGQEEREYRALWRRFYDTLSIEGRYNPKCRQTHMPKRYWGEMTEFQTDPPEGPAGLPEVI